MFSKIVFLIVTVLFSVGLLLNKGEKKVEPIMTFPPTTTNTSTSIPIIIPEQTHIPISTPLRITKFEVYSNSVIVKQDGDSISLESSDNPEAITDFYKNLFNTRGSKVKTFVSTKTNGNILNKLVGIINNETVTIEIKKNKDVGTTSIFIFKN